MVGCGLWGLGTGSTVYNKFISYRCEQLIKMQAAKRPNKKDGKKTKKVTGTAETLQNEKEKKRYFRTSSYVSLCTAISHINDCV